jgi:hypothetical protein
VISSTSTLPQPFLLACGQAELAFSIVTRTDLRIPLGCVLDHMPLRDYDALDEDDF